MHPVHLTRGGSPMDVPCGKCVGCLARRRSDWFVRLLAEFKDCQTCVFITLTYNEESAPKNQSCSRDDITNFVRRLKRTIGPVEKPLRYFISSEYCPTSGRPHYHGFLFNVPLSWKGIDFYQHRIESIWSNGFVTCSPPSFARFNYVVKYCLALADDFGGKVRPFLVANRRPAIGAVFLTDAMVKHLRETFKGRINYQGYIRPLPRYYENKVWSPEELKLRNLEHRVTERMQFINEAFKSIENGTHKEFCDNLLLEKQYLDQQEKTALKHIKKQSFNPDL
ncbi:replication initiator protein [Dipodfec virus UOA04_Rod_1021]|nr:replication initiator protein [Dipodfec virus UOA04_Rod_1021]